MDAVHQRQSFHFIMFEQSKHPESVADCVSIIELVDFFAEKTRLLKICLSIRNLGPEDRKIFQSLETDVVELKTILRDLSKDIEKCQQMNAKINGLHHRAKVASYLLDHVKANVPSVLDSYKPSAPKGVEKIVVLKTEATSVVTSPAPVVTSPTPVVSQKSVKMPLLIHPLTLPEFGTVPKYMKGRLTYENVNNFIGVFNKTIAEKYKFLSTPRSQLGNAAYKNVQEMKRQETSETKGLYFCVLDDIKTFGQIKPDNTTRSILTVLRHCSRVKEIRGPGAIVRYVVTNRAQKL